MDKKQIPVEELKLGMYVAELDRPWLGTPFLFQGFPTTSAEQIDEVKKGTDPDPDPDFLINSMMCCDYCAGTLERRSLSTM